MIHLSVIADEVLTGEFHVDLRIVDYADPGERATSLYHWHGLIPPLTRMDAEPAAQALLAVFDACREAYDRSPF